MCAHPLQQLQPLLVQQVALPQLADRALQAQQPVQVAPVALLQHLHLLLQLGHRGLQLLLAQAAAVVAEQAETGPEPPVRVNSSAPLDSAANICAAVTLSCYDILNYIRRKPHSCIFKQTCFSVCKCLQKREYKTIQ